MDLDTSGSGCVGAVLASVTSMAFIAAQSGVCTMGPKLGLSETATAPTSKKLCFRLHSSWTQAGLLGVLAFRNTWLQHRELQ